MIRVSTRRRRPVSVFARAGFTLVELMVVIIVLSILIGLLLPVLAAALRTAKQTAAQAEINQLAQALANFKAAYGDFPPSRVVLSENGFFPVSQGLSQVNGDPNDISLGALSQRTLIALRKFWPKVVFSTQGPVFPPNSNVWYDFNGNGVMDQSPYILQGDECLVFFLGGIPLSTPLLVNPPPSATATFGMTGFGKDPSNPFTNSIVGNPMYSANRQPPAFEFNPGRLFLDPNNPAPSNQAAGMIFPGIPGYYDNLGNAPPGGTSITLNFYAYFSGYSNGVYDANDINYQFEIDGNSLGPIGLIYQHALVQYPSPSPNPYTSSITANNPQGALPSGSVTYQKGQTFQIFSSGTDGLYGVGGQFTPIGAATSTASNTLPFDPGNTVSGNSACLDRSVRQREADNLTNFQSGRLQ
jgi:prepilin-type N-terminal cleavage/methylation domain-containing protein